MLLNALLLGLILPLAVAGAVLLLATLASRARPQSGAWGGAAALAAGYMAGHCGLRGWPPLPGRARLERPDWLFYLAAVAAALAVWRAARPRPAWMIHTLRTALCLASVVLLLRPLLGGWTPGVGFAWVAGLTAAGWCWWSSLDALAQRVDPAVWLMPLGIVVGATSVVTLLSGTAAVAEVQAALFAALLPALAWACRGAAGHVLRSSLDVLAILLPCTWIIGQHYADVPAHCVALLWFAPLTAWVSRLPIVQRRPSWQRAALAVAMTVAIAGIALGSTVWNFVQDGPDPYDYGDVGPDIRTASARTRRGHPVSQSILGSDCIRKTRLPDACKLGL